LSTTPRSACQFPTTVLCMTKSLFFHVKPYNRQIRALETGSANHCNAGRSSWSRTLERDFTSGFRFDFWPGTWLPMRDLHFVTLCDNQISYTRSPSLLCSCKVGYWKRYRGNVVEAAFIFEEIHADSTHNFQVGQLWILQRTGEE